MKRFCLVFGICLLTSLFDGQSAVAAFAQKTENRTDDPARFESLLDMADRKSKTEPEQALEHAVEALAIGERKQDKKMIARAQMMLAFVNFDVQRYTKAIEYALLSESFLEKSGDPRHLADVYNLLSSANFLLGNSELSDRYSDKCIELAEKHQILDILNKQYYNRGAIAYYRGDYTQALEFAFKALNIAQKNRHALYTACSYDLLGTLSIKMSEPQKAIQYFDLSRKYYLAEGNYYQIGQTHFNTAVSYINLNQPDSVRWHYYRSLHYFRKSELNDGFVSAYTGLAKYHQGQGSFDSAQLMIGKGLKAALLTESVKDLLEAYHTAGDIFFQQKQYQKSLDYYQKGLSLAIRQKNRSMESTVKEKIGQNFAVLHLSDSAYHYLSQSFAIRDSIFRFDEVQKRAYALAEHSVKEQYEKEKTAERQKVRLWFVIMILCGAVTIILIVFIRSLSVRQKKIESINAELNKCKADLEDALQDRTRKLILSEQQVLNLSNNLPSGAIFRFSFKNEREGKTLFVSSGWEELTGQSMEAANEPVFFFRDRIDPGDSRELLRALACAVQNHTILDMVYRFYKSNTDLRWFHVRAAAVAGDDGLTYLDGYLVDETDQKHFEQELMIAKNKAEESDRLKSAFLANMSHEIRTPMNAIIGFSTLLSNTQHSPQRQETYLKLIQSNCQHLLRLIDDIVDISKLEANQLNLRKENVPLSEIMKGVREHFEPIITAEHLFVELWIDEDLLHSPLNLHTDVFRLKQIFVNLIDNALKFTEKGFVRCGFLLNRPDVVHFYVMDTGIGITHNNIENIFQSFRKVDQYSNGTGLGLSILKRLLLQMGGAIWVESEPGVGSTFHFTIPRN